MSAIAAVLLTARLNSAQPIAGINYELDAIASAIIDSIGEELHVRFEAVLADPGRTFLQKLTSVTDIIGDTLGRASPAMFRDLQRSAPALYQKIEDEYLRLLAPGFGRTVFDLSVGYDLAGIRSSNRGGDHFVDAGAAVTIVDRDVGHLRQPVHKALPIFFTGLLTSSGRKDYEKHLRTCENHSVS